MSDPKFSFEPLLDSDQAAADAVAGYATLPRQALESL